MRKTFTAIALLAAFAPAAAASAGSVETPKPLAATSLHAAGTVLGAADRATIALREGDGSVLLLGDGDKRRTLAARPGCVPAAAGSGVIAWDCVATVDITDLAGAQQGSFPRYTAPGAQSPAVTSSVGSQWVFQVVPPADRGYGVRWTNWRTGATRSDDPTDPRLSYGLDTPALTAPYCGPIAASPVGATPDQNYEGPALRPVQYRAPYALIDSRTGPARPGNPVRHTLRRCGNAGFVKVPPSFTTAPAAVLGGAGWVAWRPASGSGALQIMRAATSRRFVATRAIATLKAPAIVFTRSNVWVQTSARTIARVALPG